MLRFFMKPGVAVLVVLLAASVAVAQDWELWPDKAQMPPGELLEGLPILPGSGTVATIWVDLGEQTVDKGGQQHKALQMFRDQQFDVTVTAGNYLIGIVGNILPAGTVDLVAMTTAMNLVAVEIDGTVIPIDASYVILVPDLVAPGHDAGLWNVFPRFLTAGSHTYIERYRPVEPFFWTEPYAAEATCAECGYVPDPWPQFEGRYVWVPEQVGDPVDGDIVYQYNLTVVEAPTAVSATTWGTAKQGGGRLR